MMVRNFHGVASRRWLQRLPATCAALASAFLLLAGGLRAAHAQNINEAIQGPWETRCDVTQTITASSAYTSGNAVGGLITCSGAARVAGHGGILQGVVLRDKAGQSVAYDLILLDASPGATTVTDKSAVALNTADLAKVIGTVSLSGTVLAAASTMGVQTSGGLGLPFKLTSGSTLYAILVTRGTPTYASTSDVSLSLVVLPD